MTDPVGQAEIAERTGMRPATVKQWRERHSDFPQQRWTVGGGPAWMWGDVIRWLESNGRAPHLVRWRSLSGSGLRIVEEHRNGDRWEPAFEYVDLGSGSGVPQWRSFVPTSLLLEVFGGGRQAGNEAVAQAVADAHMCAWLEARRRWLAENPGEQMPVHVRRVSGVCPVCVRRRRANGDAAT